MVDQNKKATKLIAIYARVSTALQEKEETIKTQLLAIKEFAESEGYVIVQKYIDDGWTGTILQRPALDHLREDARKKMWEAVLFYDPDRLSRVSHHQGIVMEELEELGVDVLFVTMPPIKNDEDRMLYGLKGLFAQYERAKISERFRLGKLRKAKEGHIIVSEAPYGYTFIPKTEERQGYYEINNIEACVVKKIFSWVANEGLTIRKVVKRLQELDIKPRKSKRGVWNTSTLGTLLRNRTYIGEGHYGSSYAVVPQNPLKKGVYKKVKKTSRKMRPRSEWIIIPTPIILNKKLFELTQVQLELNAKKSVRNKKNKYLLSGKIRCSCGKTRAGEGPQRGKYLYYRCTGRVHSYPLPPSCLENGINARIADKLIWNKLSGLMSSKKLMMAQMKRWEKSRSSKHSMFVGDKEDVSKEITKLKIEEDRYTKAYGSGLFTIEKLQEYLVPIKGKRLSLEKQVINSELLQKSSEEVLFPSVAEVE